MAQTEIDLFTFLLLIYASSQPYFLCSNTTQAGDVRILQARPIPFHIVDASPLLTFSPDVQMLEIRAIDGSIFLDIASK